MKRQGLDNPRTPALFERDQYNRLCARHGELRGLIAEANRKINNDVALRKEIARRGAGQWEAYKAQIIADRDLHVKEYNGISELLTADMRGRRIRTQSLRESMDGNEVSRLMLDAKQAIEDLNEQLGDAWTDAHGAICSNLQRMAKTVPSLVQPTVVERLQEEHAKELHAQKREHGRVVAALQHQVREMQSLRNRPRTLLTRLYEARYEEIDAFRTARGITHRIHLTHDDCKDIEEAIEG